MTGYTDREFQLVRANIMVCVMRKALKIVVGVVLALPVIGFIAFKTAEVSHLKALLPPACGHVDLEDKTTLVAGFGPGGHDAVLAFFIFPKRSPH